MNCNQNCKQGRECCCHQEPEGPWDELAQLGIELAGGIFAIAMVAMVAGIAVGWMWG